MHFFIRHDTCGSSRSSCTRNTDPAVERAVAEFTDYHLGKGVVPARDTPNFIAKFLGLYSVMQIFKVWGYPDAEYH